MTAIAIEFCQNFFDGNSEEITEADYHRAMGKIDEDKDAFRPDVYDLLAASKDDIVSHFAR